MPVMWFVKDGPRPDTTIGNGTELSYAEIQGAFGNHQPKYLSKDPPQLNVDSPSQYAKRVVIEVREEDGTNAEFPKSGFYLMPNLSPQSAQQLLTDYRVRK